MDLHRDVLAPAERAADAAERQPHALGRQVEAGRDLVAVDVQPLRRDVQLDAARRRRAPPGPTPARGTPGPASRPRRCPRPRRRRSASASPCSITTVRSRLPPSCSGGASGRHRGLGVGQRLEHLVVDRDRVGGPARGLGVVGGDDRDRLALVADVAPREHGLVGVLEPVRPAAGDVLVGEHGVDAGQRERGARCRARDPRARVRAAQRRAPQHPVAAQVRRVLELPAHLRHAVGARGARADHARAGDVGGAGGSDGRGHGDSASRSAASCTASTIFA